MTAETPGPAPILSIVVCTYNRAGLLADVLATLAAQTLPAAAWELIVVDNNSQDGTAAVAADFCRRYPNMRYRLETRQGLSHARNCGWRAARGRYAGYIDDDARAPAAWLAIANQIAGEIAPEAFGGPYYPFYVRPKPAWFKDTYASLSLGAAPRLLGAEEYLSGSNLFVDRRLLAELGGFDAALGMVAGRIAYGEETALQRRLRAADPAARIYYDPALAVAHLVRPEKTTLRWGAAQAFDSRLSSYVALHGGPPPRLGRFAQLKHGLRLGGELAWDLAAGLPRRDRGRYPYWQNYVYEHTLPIVGRLGMLWQQVRPGRGPQGVS